jgi:hypothetical protein
MVKKPCADQRNFSSKIKGDKPCRRKIKKERCESALLKV